LDVFRDLRRRKGTAAARPDPGPPPIKRGVAVLCGCCRRSPDAVVTVDRKVPDRGFIVTACPVCHGKALLRPQGDGWFYVSTFRDREEANRFAKVVSGYVAVGKVASVIAWAAAEGDFWGSSADATAALGRFTAKQSGGTP
jgi:hypothetical protein